MKPKISIKQKIKPESDHERAVRQCVDWVKSEVTRAVLNCTAITNDAAGRTFLEYTVYNVISSMPYPLNQMTVQIGDDFNVCLTLPPGIT